MLACIHISLRLSSSFPAVVRQARQRFDPSSRHNRSTKTSRSPEEEIKAVRQANMDDDISRFLASRHPPSHGDVDPPRPCWVLLDFCAYFFKCRNATTASCRTRDRDDEIQVTFFPAPPPRVSYFCVHCSGVEPDRFAQKPRIIATDGKFALLRVAIGPPHALGCRLLHEYYIYCTGGGGAGGGPSLELLPQPSPCVFHDYQVGLLSRRTSYIIAALRDDSSPFFQNPFQQSRYEVCLFDSDDKIWTARPISIPDQVEFFMHETSKVITVGGEHGTMAFVDLWRGILLYDVFRQDSMVRYVPLREQFCILDQCPGSPWITRDIALVKGSIKFVEIRMKISLGPGRGIFANYISSGWVASKWSRKATFPEDDSWTEDCTLDASDIDRGNDQAPLELLKGLLEKEGKPSVTLETFHIGHPMLSLDNDGIVYFMAKVHQQEKKAWIIAVDMNRRVLQGVAEFDAERTFGLSYTYTQSRIGEYLDMTPGKK